MFGRPGDTAAPQTIMSALTMGNEVFALRPALRRGDSVLLLDDARHRPAFDLLPGRYGVVAALASFDASAIGALQILEERRRFADCGKAAFFAATPSSPSAALRARFRTVTFLEESDGWASAFGAEKEGCWILFDSMARAVEVAPLSDSAGVFAMLESLTNPGSAAASPPAPILLLADVFEPALCRHLIDVFDADGGRETGYVEDVRGQSEERLDKAWKRRRDVPLADPGLVAGLRARIGRRVCPEIKRAFQFTVSRIERDLVACYDAASGGHFRAHRDDVGLAVQHRRFAMSIPLNDDFDGGEICFPEYNPQGYRPAAGGAVVFSASILHAVAPVTRGRRYVFLTFLFDEAAEKVRLANLSPVPRSPPIPIAARWG